MTAVAQLPTTRTGPASRRPFLERFATPGMWVLVVAVSGALGVVLSASPRLATVHQILVLGGVVLLAVFARRPDVVVAATVYAGLCDVLWRSSRAIGPHEGSKYAIILGFGIFAVRFVRRPPNFVVAALIVGLLMPGVLLGAVVLGAGGVREYISANLSGLIAVSVAVVALGSVRLTAAEMRGLILVALSPIASVGALATSSVLTSQITFRIDSNFAASGGFGPNQVSTLLCLGSLLCILVLLQASAGLRHRLLALMTAVWLTGQAILTFSRGGVFALTLAGVGIALAGLTMSRQRSRVMVVTAVVLLGAVQLLSWAGAFTDGASTARFTSTDSAQRDAIAEADLELFRESPTFGVGVGVSTIKRDFPTQVAPHTEYTRLLAEHGLLGLVVIGLLGTLCFRLVKDAHDWQRMAAVGLLIMALAQMTHSATRLGAIAICFGLAALKPDTA